MKENYSFNLFLRKNISQLFWVVFILISTITGLFFYFQTVSDFKNVLHQENQTILHQFQAELVLRQKLLQSYSHNDFLVGGLINDEIHNVKVLISNLITDNQFDFMGYTNYHGQTIVTTHSKFDELIQSKEISKILIEGQKSLLIQKEHLMFVQPIFYYNTPQGALVGIISQKKFNNLLNIQSHFPYSVKLNGFLYQTFSDQDKISEKASSTLELGFAEPSVIESFLPRHIMISKMVYFFGLLIIILAGFYFVIKILSQRISLRISQPLRDLVENIQSDHKSSIQLDSSVLEIRELVLVYNSQLKEINDANHNLEEKITQRTSQLENAWDNLEVALRESEKLKDAAEQASKSKSEFLANMSHEIRTPLNGVIGMAGLLMDSPLNQEQQMFASTIHSSSEILLELINDILDFSKIEAGKLDIESIELSIPQLLSEFVSMMSLRAKAKNIVLTHYVDSKISYNHLGDPVRIKQILMNLAGNAIKFTDHGNIDIQVSIESSNANIDHLVFNIKDTGIGIEEAKINQIFDKFSQADGTITRKFGGTGLGLSISQQLCHLMGGKIFASSTLGEGSTFTFVIPFPIIGPRQNSFYFPENLQLGFVGLDSYQLGACQRYLQDWKIKNSVFDSLNQAIKYLPENSPILIGSKSFDQLAIEEASVSANRLISFFGNEMHSTDKISSAKFISPLIQRDELYTVLRQCYLLENEGLVFSQETSKKALVLDTYPGLKTLLVEDNLINQNVAKALLKKLGISPQIANNGQEALNLISAQEFDIIFMDMQMPIMSGVEATIRIFEKWPNFKTPIVAMTANAMKSDETICLEAGMKRFITKPVQLQKISSILKELIP